jgi:hypothetical protein
VFWGKPDNPAGKLGLSLGLEFLREHGTPFTPQAAQHVLSDDQKLEEYSKLRVAWLKAHDWKERPRGLAFARKDTIVNEWRDNCEFINWDHFRLWTFAMVEFRQAEPPYGTRVMSREQVQHLLNRLPHTTSLLNFFGHLRLPNDRTNDDYFDYVYEVEVMPTKQEIDAVLNPLASQLISRKELAPADGETITQVWTLEQYKNATKVTFGSRHEQVARIDELLVHYHKAGSANRVSQFRIAGRLAQVITSHLTEKGSGSAFHNGTAKLGRQVWYALNHPPASA